MLRAGAGLLLLAAAASAQEMQQTEDPRPFLILNQERLLTDSQPGQALLEQEEAARDDLRAEARAIDSAFEEEERRLTEMRSNMTPAEFRELANDFDARVVEARREQDARSSALVMEFDRRRRQFYASVAPILVTVMDSFGARAILEDDTVLLADQSLNITDAVIAEIDAQAAGGGLETPPDAPDAGQD